MVDILTTTARGGYGKVKGIDKRFLRNVPTRADLQYLRIILIGQCC